MLTIPYGHTVSYGDLARQIGLPAAVRAVANANGANSISIFAPCHRVIGSYHRLTGYFGTDPQRLWSGITLCIEAEGDSTYKSAVQELNLRLSPDLLRRLGTLD